MGEPLPEPTGEPVPWLVETSSDGQKWRGLGRAWTFPGEPLLVHGASRYLRFRAPETEDWRGPMERSGSGCMALVDLANAERADVMPDSSQIGLPVLLPGGETGRLLRFEASEDGFAWNYALEFRGEVPERFRGSRAAG